MVTANVSEQTIFGLGFRCPNNRAFDPVSNTTQFLSWYNATIDNLSNQCINRSKK